MSHQPWCFPTPDLVAWLGQRPLNAPPRVNCYIFIICDIREMFGDILKCTWGIHYSLWILLELDMALEQFSVQVCSLPRLFHAYSRAFWEGLFHPWWINTACSALQWKQNDTSPSDWLLESNCTDRVLKQLALCNWLVNNVYFPRAVCSPKEAAGTKYVLYPSSHLHRSLVDAPQEFPQNKIKAGLLYHSFGREAALLHEKHSVFYVLWYIRDGFHLGEISSQMALVLRLKSSIYQ